MLLVLPAATFIALPHPSTDTLLWVCLLVKYVRERIVKDLERTPGAGRGAWLCCAGRAAIMTFPVGRTDPIWSQ